MSLREVLATLGPHERARKVTLDRFRALGGALDRVDGDRRMRVRMADALTFAEDVIEVDARGTARPYERSADRVALRTIRRRLERELQP